MTHKVVQSISDSSGLRRVDIIERADGSFGFEEWYFSRPPDEKCWVPANRQMITFTDSAESAEREARARVEWLTKA